MHPFSSSQESYDYRTPDSSLNGADAGMGSHSGMVLRRSEHQTLYLQFQSRYPMGALVSELLQIQDGKFIVRVLAQVGGVTVSSGLSSAYSPEMAEDQARLRALEVLGVFFAPATTTQEVKAELISPARGFAQTHQPQFQPQPQPQFQPQYQFQPQRQMSGAYYPEMASSEAEPEMVSQSYQAVEQPSLNFSSTSLDDEHLIFNGSDPNSMAPIASSGTPAVSPKRSPQPDSARTGSSSANSSTKSKTAKSAPLVDLSDIIAQTSVEIKRLRWTEAQGRQYLQKAYGKRSRQQLTDAELLDFLQFLEVQPSPSEALF